MLAVLYCYTDVDILNVARSVVFVINLRLLPWLSLTGLIFLLSTQERLVLKLLTNGKNCYNSTRSDRTANGYGYVHQVSI